MAIIALATMPLLVLMACTNDLSIFNTSMGNFNKQLRLE